MNLLPIDNNALTQQFAAQSSPQTWAANTVGGSNPLAELASLGKAPTRGVAATQQFQQTLASALADILSKISISGGDNQDDSNSQSNSIIPDFTKTMMPLQLSLAISNFKTSQAAISLPKNSSGGSSA